MLPNNVEGGVLQSGYLQIRGQNSGHIGACKQSPDLQVRE
jgi:hypothetical protein